jgi:hypothetical protein
VAFDGTEGRQLPILENQYYNLQEMAEETKQGLEDTAKNDDAGKEGDKWTSEVLPSGAISFNFRAPRWSPPFYFRFGVEADFFKAKKVSVSGAIGYGVFYDVVNNKSNLDKENKDKFVTIGSGDMGMSNVANISQLVNGKETSEADKEGFLTRVSVLAPLSKHLQKLVYRGPQRENPGHNWAPRP